MLLLAATIVLYYLFPQRLRSPLLLAASYIFYASYNLGLTLYLLVITGFTFFVARMIGRSQDFGNLNRAKKWMIFGVSADLLVLGFYKYFDFAAEILAGMAGMEAAPSGRLVPFGISFITFSTVSYMVDVYRGKYAAEKSLLKYAVYVSFFPKVGQGPIERAGDIISQLDEEHKFDLMRWREGMIMVLYGLFMKMVVADTAAIVVDNVYGDLNEYAGATIALATLLFALQLYCDFAGYSYTAIGAAKVLGFDFKQNFRQPYMSLSVAEFWRRWHISLNTWLRDYIYIPLGGSRCSKARKNLNTLATFTFSGLWHGADWGYVVWGLLNGIYVVIESSVKEFLSRFRIVRADATEERSPSGFAACIKKFASWFITFVLVVFSWIFFRARELPVAVTAIRRIFTKFNWSGFSGYVAEKFAGGAGTNLYGLDVVYRIPAFIVGIIVVIAVDIITNKRSCAKSLAEGPRAVRWLICYLLIFAILILGVYGYGYSAGSFIYAGF